MIDELGSSYSSWYREEERKQRRAKRTHYAKSIAIGVLFGICCFFLMLFLDVVTWHRP